MGFAEHFGHRMPFEMNTKSNASNSIILKTTIWIKIPPEWHLLRAMNSAANNNPFVSLDHHVAAYSSRW